MLALQGSLSEVLKTLVWVDHCVGSNGWNPGTWNNGLPRWQPCCGMQEEFSPCRSWHMAMLLGSLFPFGELARRVGVRNTARPYVHKYPEPSP